MGELGAEAPSIPVHLKLRSIGLNNAVVKEKDFNFHVFVHQKWTPFLMMLALFLLLRGVRRSHGVSYVGNIRYHGMEFDVGLQQPRGLANIAASDIKDLCDAVQSRT